MINFLRDVLLPCTLIGSICAVLLLLSRPFYKQLQGMLQKTLLLCGITLFILPIGLVYQSVSRTVLSIPAPQSAADHSDAGMSSTELTAVDEALSPSDDSASDQTTKTPETLDDMLQPNPAYQLGQQFGAAVQKADTVFVRAGLVWFAYFYFAGVFAFFVFFGIRYFLFRHRLYRSMHAVSRFWQLELLRTLAAEMQMRRVPLLVESPLVAAPIITGVLRPLLVLPARDMTQTQFDFAVRHELTHQKHGDLLLKLVLLFFSAMHWFNPFFHLLRREYAQVCERHCDEAVVSNLSARNRKRYATTLLSFAAQRTALAATGIASSKRELKARLVCVLKTTRRRWHATLATVTAAVLLASCCVLVGCGMSYYEAIESLKMNNALAYYSEACQIDGWVFFSYFETIYRMDLDRQNRTELFEANLGFLRGGGANNLMQCGEYLVFTQGSYIYKMDINTLETEVLLEAQNAETCFSFDVKNDDIYFVGTNIEADFQDGVYKMNIRGGTPQRIYAQNGSFWNLQIYQDQIYYSAQNEGVYRIDMDGSNQTHIITLVGEPGEFVVTDDYIFFRDSALTRYDLDGKNRITFTDSCYSFFVMNGWVIYSGEENAGECGIYKMRADKTGQEQILKFDDRFYGVVLGGYGNWIHYENMQDTDDGHGVFIEGIYRIGLDGTKNTKIN